MRTTGTECTEQRVKMLARQQNRDISEKIALGIAKPTRSKESMLDSRLLGELIGQLR
jgi:SNW domain-containing protein 1